MSVADLVRCETKTLNIEIPGKVSLIFQAGRRLLTDIPVRIFAILIWLKAWYFKPVAISEAYYENNVSVQA